MYPKHTSGMKISTPWTTLSYPPLLASVNYRAAIAVR